MTDSSSVKPGDMVPIGPRGDVAEVESAGTELQEWNAEVLASVPGLQEAFLAMLADVPGTAEDATARIVAQILEADNVQALDAPWDAEGMRDYADVILGVHDIRQMPSDYAGGLGVYLVCTVADPASGEEFVVTTGSVSIVAQLVRAYTQGWLPLQVIPRKSDKPTKNGYFPMHLELVRQARRKRPQVIDQPAPGRSREQEARQARAARILDEARAAAPQEG